MNGKLLRIQPDEQRIARILVLSLALCAVAFLPASGKSAEDYFHGAASHYVAGQIQEASVEAEEGLRLHPDDARLRMLAEQLKKMKDQQRGNSGQGGGKDQKRDPGKKPGDPDKQDPDKKNPDDKNGDKQGDKPQPPKPGEPPKDPGDKGDQDGKQAPQPNRMSEEEAKRLLNSFADDEKKEQAERRKAVRQRAGTEQDW